MPKITKVRIDDLVSAANKYVDGQIARADLNKDKKLTPTEAKKLAVDLRDNFGDSQFKNRGGSVTAADLKREFLVSIEAWARASDKNNDGFISITETKSLPANLRDNVLNYISAQQSSVSTSGGLTTRDTSVKAEVTAQTSEFGGIPYADAFAKALDAAATDENGLKMFVAEYGGPNGDGLSDPRQIDAAVKKLLQEGSISLVPRDEEIPTGETAKDNWIFSINTDGVGDNGVWAIIDRKTGDASIETFN
jgi:hypothetical protein